MKKYALVGTGGRASGPVYLSNWWAMEGKRPAGRLLRHQPNPYELRESAVEK